MKILSSMLLLVLLTGCSTFPYAQFEKEILDISQRNLPAPDTHYDEVTKLWTEVVHVGFPRWRGKGKETRHHGISWANEFKNGEIFITLIVKYDWSKVIYSRMVFPDLHTDGMYIDKDGITMPREPSRQELLVETRDILLRLEKELEANRKRK